MEYFPYTGACSSLLQNMFSTELLQKEMNIHVLAVKHALSDPDMEVIDGITIHRIIRWESLSVQELKTGFKQMPFIICQGLCAKTVSKMKRRLNLSTFLDRQLLHSLNRKLDRLSSESYDVVIPVAGYYEAVQAALDSFQNKKTKVIIYQVDPCSTNIAYSAESYLERLSFEKKLCEVADSIITTPILYKQWLLDHHDEANNKIISMEFPNVNPGHQTLCDVPEKHSKQEYNCVFAGGIYRAARNPAYTLRLFSVLNGSGIKLSIVGAEKENMQEFLDVEKIANNISFYGRLPLKEAQRHMEHADVLVNIGNVMINQVPSKIFEYISQGKPIVNVCVNHDCPTIPYLEKYPYVLNLFEGDDTDEQTKKLKEFVCEHAGKRLPAAYIVKEYERCTAAYCARQMLEIM